MTDSILRTALAALALAVASPAFIACSDASPGQEAEQTGTLNAALLTVGSDGATYQFPPGTTVRISQGNFSDTFALDGMESVLNLELPVGTLQVELQFPNMTPQLVRTVGTVSSLVDAVWLDTPPVLVSIAADTTTALTLHFELTGLGDVTFDMGTLALALEVQRNATAQPAQLLEEGTYTHDSSIFGPTATPIAQLFFGMAAGETHVHSLDFNVTGPWQQQSTGTICAPALFESLTTMEESGFSRLVNIVAGQVALVCVEDAGTADKFFVNTELVGPAPPPFDTGALPSGNYRFFLSVSGFLGDVYDGRTFRQSTLETFTSFSGGEIFYQIFDNTVGQETLSSQGSLSGSIRLAP
jgi:hypothetical protein